MLCHFCQNLVFVPVKEVSVQNVNWWLPGSRFIFNPDTDLVSVHQPSRKALELSAGQGCRVCAMFSFQLFQNTRSVHAPRDNDHEIAPVLLSIGQHPADRVVVYAGKYPDSREMKLRCGEKSISLRTHKPISDDLSTRFDLSCILSSESEERCNPIGSAVDNYTGSDHNMDLIRTWFQECQKGHCLCNTEVSSQTLPLLPTRIIEITNDSHAHIVETIGMRAEYLTLSYCWGQGKKLLCTRGSGSYEQFKQKLPVDDMMPMTFKDALQVTRVLGYHYLWIDALCIIQDDLEDVGKEIARMGDIYRQSTLTILAANGPDTDSGLFSKRDARGSKSCNVWTTSKRGSNYLRKHLSIQPWIRNRHHAPRKRGWILQEEILSKRLLTFDNTDVAWSCVMGEASECDPCMGTSAREAVKESELYSVTQPPMRLIARHPSIFDKLPPPVYGFRWNHFDVWYETIRGYSERILSVDSDKLLAIAGLASIMQQHYGLTYVTGLWREDLQAGLCWKVSGRHKMFCRDGPRSITESFPDYLAPTWSWASAHGMCVEFSTVYLQPLPEEGMQVVDVEVSHLPGALATFGYIKFAKLSICTRMWRISLASPQIDLSRGSSPEVDEEKRPMCVYAFDTPRRSFVSNVLLDSFKVYEDISKRYPIKGQLKKIYLAPEGTSSKKFCTHQLLSDGYEVWCVPCLVQGDGRGGRQMETIVLTPINADRREYRRIGIMKILSKDYDRFMAGKAVHEDREIIHIL